MLASLVGSMTPWYKGMDLGIAWMVVIEPSNSPS